MTNKKTIAMAGGGSGGHVFPIQSLLEFLDGHKEFRSNVDSVYRFGNSQSLEYKSFLSCQKSSNIKVQFLSIQSGKFRRETKIISQLKNICDIFLFIFGFFQAFFGLIYYGIDVVFCKGGHVALPVVIAARILRKKIILHESDVSSGLTNRIAAKFATKIFTGFPGVFKDAKVVGQILSDDFLAINNPKNNKLKKQDNTLIQDELSLTLLKLNKKKPLILILGGSLGSKRLYNELKIFMQNEKKLASQFEFIAIGGFLNKEISSTFKIFSNVHTFNFVSQKEMGQLCYYADIGITRAGTTSLAEQKLYDMKLLIVPISRTHDQYKNADFYVKKYGDIQLDQKKEFQKNLKENIEKLSTYKKKLSNINRLEKIQKVKQTIRENILL